MNLIFTGPSKAQTSKKYKNTNVPFQTQHNLYTAPVSGQSSAKGKKKYVNFYAQDHRPGLIKGY